MLEIVVGIVIGPSVLGWVEVDEPVEVIALVGLAFLLFLAGLEIEFDAARPRAAARVGWLRRVARRRARRRARPEARPGSSTTPLLVAIILCRDLAGRDRARCSRTPGRSRTTFGQLVIAAASIADFGGDHPAVDVLLRRGRHRRDAAPARQLFALVARRLPRSCAAPSARCGCATTLLRLQDTTAQIRVRGAFVLLIGFAALAESLGLEVILGAFIAGAIVSLVDRDERDDAPGLPPQARGGRLRRLHPRLLRHQRRALRPRRADRVGVEPADGPDLPGRAAGRARAAGARLPAPLGRSARWSPALLQATSLPFIVAATAIGLELGLIDAAASAALIGAGLLSVLLFPLGGIVLLRHAPSTPSEPQRQGAS